jgi:hydroxylamine dehydrogenase
MMTRSYAILGSLCCLALGAPAQAQLFGPKTMTEQTKQCVSCHREQNPGLYQQWGASKHYRGNVGCFECHSANKTDADAFEHYGQIISTLVTPKDCARCHSQEVEEFSASIHAKAARVVGSLNNFLGDVVEGHRPHMGVNLPPGHSPTTVSGCAQCHGSEIKVIGPGKLDPATWPNSGIGRINPDGSLGTCTSCHSRHTFSVSQARHPDTCGKCHTGPDHAQKEIYATSLHGINFAANQHEMNLQSPKWIAGEDYSAAPTCATCHMSATRKQPVTHDVGVRISWNNRPEVSVRPEVVSAALGLPNAEVPWDLRRANMKDVCMSCHHEPWVDGFYTQYDQFIDLYNTKFAIPGKALYELAKPLLKAGDSGSGGEFRSSLDWSWHEIWHGAGRRARHGAAMMSPSHVQAHGMQQVAERFYREFVPELQALAAKNMASTDPRVQELARALQAKLDEVLGSEEHKWYLGFADPREAEQRARAVREFSQRYDEKPSP